MRRGCRTACLHNAEYGTYLNMLHFGEATLTFPQTLVLRYSRFEPEHRRQPTVAEDYVVPAPLG